ncbi:hypothetical protein SEUCBS140593_010406 [Sporothrix eucalyptigena]|uniref:Uncharacterized protein n=1 Tax=Sporothrix eucalyptigena TaxID=1812306 RepID=A0ABP0D193_9PEZI
MKAPNHNCRPIAPLCEHLISDIDWAADEVAVLGIVDSVESACREQKWDISDADEIALLLESLECDIGRLVQSEAEEALLAGTGLEQNGTNEQHEHEQHETREQKQQEQPGSIVPAPAVDNLTRRPLPCVAGAQGKFYNQNVQADRVVRFYEAQSRGLRRSTMSNRRRLSAPYY